MRRSLGLLLVVIFSPLMIVRAQIPANKDFVQTELNALFVVDEALNQTTGYFNISYMTDSAESVMWVFPLPPESTNIDTLPPMLIPSLEQETRPILGTPSPYHTCNLMVTDTVFYGPLIPRREYIASENGVTDIVSSLDELLPSLSQPPTEDQLGVLRQYAELGWSFVTTSFAPPTDRVATAEDDAQLEITHIYTSPTISFTFPGAEPALPIALHAPETSSQFDEYSSENSYAITTLISAEKPYVPQKQKLVELSFDDLPSTNMIGLIQFSTSSPYEYPGEFSLYFRRLEASANSGDTPHFIVESVTNPHEILAGIPEDNNQKQALQAIIDEKPYLTRLRTIVATNHEIPETTGFVPDNTLDYFVYDTIKLIDPAIYWGCTTEVAEDRDLETRLPSGRTHIADLHADVAHPDGWELSVLKEGARYALAPQPVDRLDVQELELGRGEFPILVLESLELRYELDERGYYVLPDRTWDWFMRSSPRFNLAPMRNAVSIYFPTGISNLVYDPRLEEGDYSSVTGYRAVIMAPPADWVENETLYDDMLRYFRTYPYFTSPELRHTLMLGELGDAVAIGYPQGWHTRLDQKLGRLIIPEEADNSAYIRIYELGRSDSIETVATIYRLHNDGFADAEIQKFQDVDGRSGYMMYVDLPNIEPQIIEFSAPVAEYETYASLLQKMAESVVRF